MIERRWLRPRDAATYIGISLGTLYSWASDETLPRGCVVRIARRNSRGIGRHAITLRIDKIQLDAWLSRRAR